MAGLQTKINVRLERWYFGYFEKICSYIKGAPRKFPDRDIILVGIEGCPTFGERTLQEFGFVVADIDIALKDGKLTKRPETTRVPFQKFEKTLERLIENEKYYIIVFSCPARIDDNFQVMAQVEDICTKESLRAFVDIAFSDADDAGAAFRAHLKVVDPTLPIF
jgi:hypothetical protein